MSVQRLGISDRPLPLQAAKTFSLPPGPKSKGSEKLSSECTDLVNGNPGRNPHWARLVGNLRNNAAEPALTLLQETGHPSKQTNKVRSNFDPFLF
jgi:hypothetical protein